MFREMGLFGIFEKFVGLKGNGGEVKGVNSVKNGNNRWSDCGCEDCVLWMRDQKLHVVVRESSKARFAGDCTEKKTENVIFLHGFLSSSSFWTETIFPKISENRNRNYKLFAVDLLGFGKSPKPRDCLYTIKDHVEMIENSVLFPFKIDSFHVVAHSMGCVIALALAAKYSDSVKSITLVAPPYFPCPEDGASLKALDKLAGKKIWPPVLFGSAVMSWYEHLGRCVCFFICRNHRIWESILKLLTRKRDLHFMIMDLTRHTHHSAWHTMHNVICGGANLMDTYLEKLQNSHVSIHVIQGSRDAIVPLECSSNVKKKVPEAEVRVIKGADHSSVIIGREKVMALEFERIWEASVNKKG